MALNDIDAAAVSFKKALDFEPNDGKNHFWDKTSFWVAIQNDSDPVRVYTAGIKRELAIAKKKVPYLYSW